MQQINVSEALDDKTKSHLKNVIGVLQQNDEDEEEETTNDNQNLIKEKEYKMFWERRSTDTVVWSMFLNFGNFIM